MDKDEMGSVEEVAFEFKAVIMLDGWVGEDAVRGTVEEVADDRVAERLHVNADLVGPAGLDLDMSARVKGPKGVVRRSRTVTCETAERAPGSEAARRVVMRVRRMRSRAMGRLTGDVVLGEMAVDKSEVVLFEAAL